MSQATKMRQQTRSKSMIKPRASDPALKDKEKIRSNAATVIRVNKTNATILNLDCLVAMRAMPSSSIDMVLCDLPYGKTMSSWDIEISLDELFAEYQRICKPDGAIVLFGAMPFTGKLVSAGRSIFRYSYVWEKNKATGHLNASRMPLRIHEDILVFYAKQPLYTAQKSTNHHPMSKNYKEAGGAQNVGHVYGCKTRVPNQAGSTQRHPTSILRFSVVNNSDPARFHPNQKPVDLLRWLIRTYSKAGDIILDNTAGSGSTGEAAMLEGRSFIGIERDCGYYDGMVRRLEDVAMRLKSKNRIRKQIASNPVG